MRSIKWFAEIALFLCISFPVAVLPHKIALKAGEILGLLVFYIWSSRRRIAVDNVEKSKAFLMIPETSGIIAKKMFMNLGKSLVEVIKIYCGFGRRLVDNVEIRGIEHCSKALSRGKGIIVITAHCGNWELMALAFGIKVHKASVVARMQNNPYLNRIIEKVRAKYGNSVIYKKGALKGIFSALKKNGAVGILMDQAVLKEEGFIVDFLGRPAWTTKMPALMARKTGAAVIPVFIHREGDGHVMNIHPEVVLSEDNDAEKAVVEDTKRFSACIDDCIREYPAEWLWIHRRWKRT